MGRALEKLTALQIERKAKVPGLYNDGGGLCLRVSSTHAQSWVLRYMLNGRPREMGLGPYPDITLANARVAAAEARKLKAMGKDPIEVREAQRAAERAEAARAITFRQCAESYIASHRNGWRNAKHAAQWTATLETYAMPVIGKVPIQTVDVAMIHKILEPIWSAKAETAGRVRQRIENILDWAATRGYRNGENPARWRGHLENLFPALNKVRGVKHHAALPYSEMPEFWAALSVQNGFGALALRLTILTASRTGEVIGATWAEFDLEGGVWTIPGSRMKSARDHRVPLSKPVLALLRGQHAETGGDGYVFPGGKRGKPLSNMAMLETLRRMGRENLTVHGFRSTFRDWAAERTNFNGEVAEAALAHVVGDKVEAAYRRGDLFEKRRKLMATWASFCTTPAEGKIVHLARKTG